MDAHVFRRLCEALTPLLMGARLEKIQSPAEDIFVFTFYTGKRKQHLVLRASRKDPFLYMAAERPVTGAPPSALVMRWRKYCVGRRVASVVVDWTGRSLSLLFACPQFAGLPPAPFAGECQSSEKSKVKGEVTTHSVETWLTLDLREGVRLLLGQSPDLPEEPTWPGEIVLADAVHNWRQWPVLTPALRRTLPHLEFLDQLALLADLEAGGGDIFAYGQGEACELSAWPLPEALGKKREERIFEEPLQAASVCGDALVLGAAALKSRKSDALPHVREAARLTRLLEKLEKEEERLCSMAAGKEKGLLLQASLWRFAPEAKLAAVAVDDATTESGTRELALDHKITVRENMQAFFHQAARGARGLEFLVTRRENLRAQLEAVRLAAAAAEAGAVHSPPLVHSKQKDRNRDGGKHKGQAQTKDKQGKPVQNTSRGGDAPSNLNLPRGVQAFRSSDNFIILRGRDAKGNWAALRAAGPQDLWLHVEGGPGSHAIIRRHFSGQEIPERTLLEAASLAAVKSWQKDNPTAHILCAEVRHVKPMRGAAPGTVRIDKAGQSFRVDIDSAVEERLAL